MKEMQAQPCLDDAEKLLSTCGSPLGRVDREHVFSWVGMHGERPSWTLKVTVGREGTTASSVTQDF